MASSSLSLPLSFKCTRVAPPKVGFLCFYHTVMLAWYTSFVCLPKKWMNNIDGYSKLTQFCPQFWNKRSDITYIILIFRFIFVGHKTWSWHMLFPIHISNIKIHLDLWIKSSGVQDIDHNLPHQMNIWKMKSISDLIIIFYIHVHGDTFYVDCIISIPQWLKTALNR